jgi:hypothetical protein
MSDMSEQQFAEMVDRYSTDSAMRGRLIELLRENHSLYAQRGAAAVVRMRGWVVLSLARGPLPDEALAFVLEELDTARIRT